METDNEQVNMESNSPVAQWQSSLLIRDRPKFDSWQGNHGGMKGIGIPT